MTSLFFFYISSLFCSPLLLKAGDWHFHLGFTFHTRKLRTYPPVQFKWFGSVRSPKRFVILNGSFENEHFLLNSSLFKSPLEFMFLTTFLCQMKRVQLYAAVIATVSALLFPRCCSNLRNENRTKVSGSPADLDRSKTRCHRMYEANSEEVQPDAGTCWKRF